MIVYDENNVQLEYQPEASMLAVRWVGQVEPETLPQLIRQIVGVVHAYAIENILLDATMVDTLRRPVLFNAQVQPYFQQALAIPSVKKMARVSSGINSYERAITPLYATLVHENQASFTFQTFTHLYEALQWLTQR